MGHSCCYGERNENIFPGSSASPKEKEALLDAKSKLKFQITAHHNPTNANAGFGLITVSQFVYHYYPTIIL